MPGPGHSGSGPGHGSGRHPLRSEDDVQNHEDDDLLDRREAAAVLGVVPDSWRVYKRAPLLTEHMTLVGGVELWPRGVVHRYRDTALDARPRPDGPPVPGTRSRVTNCSRARHRSWMPTPPSPRPPSWSSSA
ncbi:hypothetical protein ACIF6K_30995 [Streptomyces sp. NPDC085942]|uniref:hypothetical protein n=1 Tax=Streptomyces sp. NPDC085942 TaxID=3365743 RepID=UPI0037D165B2